LAAIEDSNLMALLQQSLDDRRTKISASADDE
jgi:hypothetical protein